MNNRRTLLYSICLAALLTSLIVPAYSARAQTTSPVDIPAVDAYLQAQVKVNRIPGMAVAFVKDDQVVFQKGYGDAAAGKPVTPQTQFYIGSVTKSFTALAVMKLVKQGNLELDTPVQSYIPWFKVADEQVSAQITVRHLLNHTSGLTEKSDPNSAAYTDSLEEQTRLMQYVKPVNPPGEAFEYYNQNYRVLGFLVEVVSGQSFGDFLKENILLPLGMTSTVYDPDDAPDLAQGHSRFFGFPLPQTQAYIPGGLPSGYLITTAEDMSRYIIGLLNNRQIDGQRLLNAELLAETRTPPKDIDSPYGMGWMLAEDNNMLVHGGALHYFQSFVALNPRENSGFVSLYNQNSMENMLYENSTINSDLIEFLNGNNPAPANHAWAGLILLGLAVVDLLNHLRLFHMVPRWVEKTEKQERIWLWIKVVAGILFPLVVIFGLPSLMNAVEGGAPDWVEPFRLMPDLTVWLLLGMVLNVLRSSIHAVQLYRRYQDLSARRLRHVLR